jgi:plasmid stabilization system protein ParE
MKFTISEEAKDEAAGHVAWFTERNPVVGDRLAELFVSTIEQIGRNPQKFPLLEYRGNPGNIRRVRLKKFPIIVLYQLLDEEIYVFAVPHTSQRPGYWRSRLRK